MRLNISTNFICDKQELSLFTYKHRYMCYLLLVQDLHVVLMIALQSLLVSG